MTERTPATHPRSHGRPPAACTSAACSSSTADTTTISSERLAELAGVNAAKVRKDLSYLGSYGTRGVGYDVEYLLFQMSRELGLTQDWPVVIVGIGNLGQALANYGGFGDRGFPVAALVDADPAKVGQHGRRASSSATSTTCPSSSPSYDIAIGIIATPGARGPGRRRPPGRRRHHLDPQLRAGGDHGARRRVAAQGRPRRRAADPELLPAAARPATGGRVRAGDGRATPSSTAACMPVDEPLLPGEPARRRPALPRRRRRAGRARQGARACSRRGAVVHGGRPRRGRRARRPLGRRRRVRASGRYRAGRGRPATGWSIAATDDPAVNGAVFRDGEAAGVWVNSADDPDALLLHPAGPRPPGPAARHVLHRRAQPGAGHVAAPPARRASSARSTRP